MTSLQETAQNLALEKSSMMRNRMLLGEFGSVNFTKDELFFLR
jgi:hypothetical protein